MLRIITDYLLNNKFYCEVPIILVYLIFYYLIHLTVRKKLSKLYKGDDSCDKFE